MTENGCKWRALPKEYGKWYTIYMRMNRRSKKGVLDRVFAALQAEGIINIEVDVVCLDSTTVKVHPDACGKKMRTTAEELGYAPVVPPKRNYKEQWEYDEKLYKRRNEVERLDRKSVV